MRALAIVLLLSAGGSAMAYEEPDYEVVQSYEDFELRRYAPYLVAETTVEDDFGAAGSTAFRILADYIFGNNRRREKMAMTAPVDMQPAEGEKIAMTAPVTQVEAGGGEATGERYVFRFVMPSEYTLETLPEPVDERVTLRELPARWVAARRYSGTWSESYYREQETALLEALAAAGFSTRGTPIFARYNSPFSLWFLRRNEVLIEVAEPG